MSLSVNDRWHLGYPAASSPKEDGIISVPHLVGHRSMTFGSAWVESKEITRASIWRVLALAKAEALKRPEQHWRHTMDQVEV
jgi:hypothetical protein